MNLAAGPLGAQAPADSGLVALCGVSAYYRIPANPSELRRQLVLPDGATGFRELARAALILGLKARWIQKLSKKRLGAIPAPSLVRLRDGGFHVYGGKTPDKLHRIVDPITRAPRDLPLDELYEAIEPQVLLLARKLGGKRCCGTLAGAA